MELVTHADLLLFSYFLSAREVVRRWICFPILGILRNDLVELGVVMLFRESSVVQRVNVTRIKLEEGVDGRIVDRLGRWLRRRRKKREIEADDLVAIV